MGEALMQDRAMSEATHKDMANAIRALAMDAVQKANSGHPGMPMGMADVATVLFTRFLKFDAAHPDWPDRDRFVLSAGHGSMLLYALLYLPGYPGMDIEEIKRFRQLGERHADRVADALPERPSGRLNARRMTVFGIPRRARAELPDCLLYTSDAADDL